MEGGQGLEVVEVVEVAEVAVVEVVEVVVEVEREDLLVALFFKELSAGLGCSHLSHTYRQD